MLTVVIIPVLNDNYSYLLHDPLANQTAVVDPALAEPVLAVLKQRQWSLDFIFNTHHHSDHIGGNSDLKAQTGCQIIASTFDQSRIPNVDISVKDNDRITLGNHTAQVLATPGHTLGHIVFHFAEDKLLFCGDTLFAMGCGRLFEGTAAQLCHSLEKLKSLPPETQVYCAHEYTQANSRFACSIEPNNQALQQRIKQVNHLRTQQQPTMPFSIAEELATNPFFRTDNSELQQNIGLIDQPALTVFTQLRQLKDRF